MLYTVESDHTGNHVDERRHKICHASGTNLDFTSSARITRQLRPFRLLSWPNSLLYRNLVHVDDVIIVRGEVDVGSFHSLRWGEEDGRIGQDGGP